LVTINRRGLGLALPSHSDDAANPERQAQAGGRGNDDQTKHDAITSDAVAAALPLECRRNEDVAGDSPDAKDAEPDGGVNLAPMLAAHACICRGDGEGYQAWIALKVLPDHRARLAEEFCEGNELLG
jgi:hypothetical protein